MKRCLYIIFAVLSGIWLLDWFIQFTREPHKMDYCGDYLDTEYPPHVDGPDCWCHPTLFFDGEGEFSDVWVHKGNGEELPHRPFWRRRLPMPFRIVTNKGTIPCSWLVTWQGIALRRMALHSTPGVGSAS